MKSSTNTTGGRQMESTRKVTGTRVSQTDRYYMVELWENGSTDPTRLVITYKASGKTEFISTAKGGR
jgi:hypothetical protein